MNRLRNQRCYLAGPIDRAKNLGQDWRKEITPLLQELGVIVYDPLNKPIQNNTETVEYIEARKKRKKENDFRYVSQTMTSIRKHDLRLVDRSDFLILNLDLESSPVGAWEEFFRANSQEKPTLIIFPAHLNELPDWLFGLIPTSFVFKSIFGLINYLKFVDQDLYWDNHMDRWIFIEECI